MKTMEGRKVIFKKYTPFEQDPRYMGEVPIEGTDCFSEDFTEQGIFHQLFYNERNDLSFAAIENSNGFIECIGIEHFKFVN